MNWTVEEVLPAIRLLVRSRNTSAQVLAIAAAFSGDAPRATACSIGASDSSSARRETKIRDSTSRLSRSGSSGFSTPFPTRRRLASAMAASDSRSFW